LQLLARDSRHEIVHVSAYTGEGLERLEMVVRKHLDARSSIVEVTLPISDGRTLAALRRAGALLEQRTIEDHSLMLRLKLSESALGNLRRSSPRDVVFRVIAAPDEPRVSTPK
jgi:50S ribosomal subunit-associated GTPase HflX